MTRWWQFYQRDSKKKRQSSITKDDVALLAEHMDIFTPRFSHTLSFYEGITYVLAWSVFVIGFKLDDFATWQECLASFSLEALTMGLTLWPCTFFIRLQQEHLQHVSIFRVCLRIIITTVSIGIVVSAVILFSANLLGVVDLDVKSIIGNTISHALDVLTLTAVILMFSIRRYKELRLLKALFDKQLATQNDHIKTRLAPHFFFNTINTLASLVETDSDQASELIKNVSHLFRSSFSDPKESSLEEEIELCEHYLAIEHYRLQDKLVVMWDLPDEDLIYDMSITSLTLQNVLEQTVLHVVEMTTKTVYINVHVKWQNHIVTIVVSAEMPINTLISPNTIKENLSFDVQQSRLREHFGPSATITTDTVKNQVISTIVYPLHDAFD